MKARYLCADYIFHLAAFFANQNSVDYPEKDLLVSQLDKAGVRLDDGLGDSTGRLVELAPLANI